MKNKTTIFYLAFIVFISFYASDKYKCNML